MTTAVLVGFAGRVKHTFENLDLAVRALSKAECVIWDGDHINPSSFTAVLLLLPNTMRFRAYSITPDVLRKHLEEFDASPTRGNTAPLSPRTEIVKVDVRASDWEKLATRARCAELQRSNEHGDAHLSVICYGGGVTVFNEITDSCDEHLKIRYYLIPVDRYTDESEVEPSPILEKLASGCDHVELLGSA